MKKGLNPSEFWALHPTGWWWWYESQLPPQIEIYAELYEMLNDGN